VLNELDSLKGAASSYERNWSIQALEWMSLLPGVVVCAWVILNFG
jgi:hypothetical protein